MENNYIPEKIENIKIRPVRSLAKEPLYALKNTLTRSYLTLNQRQYSLWELIDGQKNLGDIIVAYCQNNKSLAVNTVINTIDTLRKNNFLKNPAPGISEDTDPAGSKKNFFDYFKIIQYLFSIHINIKPLTQLLSSLGYKTRLTLASTPAIIASAILTLAGFYLLINRINTGSGTIFNINGSYPLGIIVFILANIVISFITCLLQSAFLSAREGGIERSGLKFPCAFPGIYIDTSDLALLSPREKITFYAYTLTSTCALGGLSLLLVRFINISVLTQGFYVTAMAAYLRALILCSPLMDSPLYGLLREGLSIDLLRPKAFTFLKNKLWKKFKEKGGFNKEEQSYFLYLLLSIIWILGLSRTGIYLIKSDIAAALYKLFSSGNPLAYILSAGLAIGFLLPLSLSVLYAVSLLIQTLIKWLRASNVWQSADKISFINLGLLSCLSLLIFILPDKFRELSPVILQVFLSLLALITGISARKQFKGSAFGRIFSGVNLFLIALIIKKSLTQSFSSLSFFSERFSAGSFVIAPGNIPLILAVLAGACILTGFFNLFLRERPGPGLNKGLIMPAIITAALLIIFQNSLRSLYYDGFTLSSTLVILNIILLILTSALVIPRIFQTPKTRHLTGWILFALALVLRIIVITKKQGEIELDAILGFYFWEWLTIVYLSAFWTALLFFWLSSKKHLFRTAPYQARADSSQIQTLTRSGSYMFTGILTNIKDYYGPTAANTCRTLFNHESEKQNWGIQINNTQIDLTLLCRKHRDDIIRTGQTLKSGFLFITDFLAAYCGRSFTMNLVHHCLAQLHWADREIISNYVFNKIEGLEQSYKEQTRSFPLEKRIRLLKTAPLFQGLNQDRLTTIANLLRYEELAPEQAVINQDEPGDKFYMIIAGKAAVYVENTAGETHLIAHLKDGDYFGETALLKNVPRTATIKAVTRLQVFYLRYKDFNAYVRVEAKVKEKIMQAIEDSRLIKSMELFSEFKAEHLNILLSRFKRETFQTGQTIIKQGETGDKFYVISKGSVEIIHRESSGNPKKTARLERGQYFGEIALLRNIPRTSSVQTIEPVEVMVLNKDVFVRLLDEFSAAGRILNETADKRITAALEITN